MPYFYGAVSIETILADLVAALDRVELGVVLLDRDLRACFVNQRFADMWSGPREALTTGLRFRALLELGADGVCYDVPADQFAAYLDEREAAVREGTAAPVKVNLRDGRLLLFRCVRCPGGGRLITYADITPLKEEEEAYLRACAEAESASAEQRFIAETLEEQASQLVTLAESADENARRVERMNRLLKHEMAERRQLEARLRHMASIDGLTGTLNHARFLTVAQRALGKARRAGQGIVLLMLDIDHFKHINDQFGHSAGDAALKHFVSRLRAGIREHDLIGRLGGEEFAIMLQGIDKARGFEVAERLRMLVAEAPLQQASHTIAFTVSIGLATPRDSDKSIAQTLARADARLYTAKKAGRNQVWATDDPLVVEAAVSND
ncbi:MAG TPA: diguanylate cyclase [Acetobacteraceae bacterium]|nr:diguanylate cyclase [Acetobacteraceae bacterium]